MVVKLRWFSILVIAAALYSGCVNMLPVEFKTDESYSLQMPDEHACYYLTRDSVTVDTLTGEVSRFYVPVSAKPVADINAAWVDASLAEVENTFDKMVDDTLMVVSYPAGEDTVCLYVDKESDGSSIFYFSWDLDETNHTAFIDVSVLDKSGEKVSLVSSAVSSETLALCTQQVIIGGLSYALPVVRNRSVFNLPAGQYLVQMTISKPDAIPAFKAVVLNQ